MTLRILRMPELQRTVGLRRARIYEMVRAGSFPQPCKLGERAVGWRADEVASWIEALPRCGAECWTAVGGRKEA